MEPLLVGALAAATTAAAVLYWQLLSRPAALLATLGGVDDEWLEVHPGALTALRVLGGATVFFLGFATGTMLTFLLGT